jgi:hypothetical protein
LILFFFGEGKVIHVFVACSVNENDALVSYSSVIDVAIYQCNKLFACYPNQFQG